MNLLFSKILASAALILSIGLYDIQITTIEGGTKTLSTYNNKKILVIELPVTPTASNTGFLQQLDSLSSSKGDSVVVIGVPANEEGYTAAAKTTLQGWYRSVLNSRIIITDGMYTKKASGASQHPLFSWLTHKSSNGHFDDETKGVGQKYLIDESGALTAVLGPEIKLSSRVFNRLINN